MKKIYLALTFMCITMNIGFAQELAGTWLGKLAVGGNGLRIVFGIGYSDNGYTATMQSPDQSPVKIPVATVTYANAGVTLEIPSLTVVYKGNVVDGDMIKGVFTQQGQSFPLDLSRLKDPASQTAAAPQKPNRPQEPKAPYPYREEEVVFSNNEAAINLAGTFTCPAQSGRFPAVILVAGSGPNNRNEEIFGHKPFLVLADHLTRNGIAVLRYDKRGTGKSEGNFASASIGDFASDARAAIDYLRSKEEVDNGRIGIIGHSEGASVAFVVAAGDNVSFLVSLAGSGIKGVDLLDMQREAIFSAAGMSKEYIEQSNALLNQAYQMTKSITDRRVLEEKITELFAGTMLSGQAPQTVRQLTSAGMRSFLDFDPQKYYPAVRCPVLALNGEKDLQVPYAPNLKAIEQGISSNGNNRVTTISYPGLNHLFQQAKTGLVDEYGRIEETFNPVVMDGITGWILKIVK